MPPSSQFVCSTRARCLLSKPLKTMVLCATVLSCIYYVNIGGDGRKRKEPTFREIDVARDLPFDVNKDVFAPLNIPKTGTLVLVYHITHNSDIKPRCRFFKAKGFRCVSATNSTWLLGESKKGSNCGPNSDWTELTECIEARFGENEGKTAQSSYRYITLLRDPIQRFISEFLRTKKIVKIADVNSCHGRLPSQLELPDCFDGARNLTLDWFLACRSNLAINRQTRMLADLRLVNCYNKTGMTEKERDRRLLESAKENLLKMSFFGLTDYQHLSQVVFEETFHVKFLSDFEEFNVTHASKAVISPSDLERITKVNHNDVELYNFAKSLLMERARYMNLQ